MSVTRRRNRKAETTNTNSALERLRKIQVFDTKQAQELETITLAELKEALGVVVNPKVQVSKSGYLGIGVKNLESGRTSTILFGKKTAEDIEEGDSVADLVADGMLFTVSVSAEGEERIKAFLPGSGAGIDTSDWV